MLDSTPHVRATFHAVGPYCPAMRTPECRETRRNLRLRRPASFNPCWQPHPTRRASPSMLQLDRLCMLSSRRRQRLIRPDQPIIGALAAPAGLQRDPRFFLQKRPGRAANPRFNSQTPLAATGPKNQFFQSLSRYFPDGPTSSRNPRFNLPSTTAVRFRLGPPASRISCRR